MNVFHFIKGVLKSFPPNFKVKSKEEYEVEYKNHVALLTDIFNKNISMEMDKSDSKNSMSEDVASKNKPQQEKKKLNIQRPTLF